MKLTVFELLAATLVALLSAVVSVIWLKVDRTERTAEANRISLSYLSKSIDKTIQMTERLASLEASFRVEIKNLSLAVRRMERAISRTHEGEDE